MIQSKSEQIQCSIHSLEALLPIVLRGITISRIGAVPRTANELNLLMLLHERIIYDFIRNVESVDIEEIHGSEVLGIRRGQVDLDPKERCRHFEQLHYLDRARIDGLADGRCLREVGRKVRYDVTGLFLHSIVFPCPVVVVGEVVAFIGHERKVLPEVKLCEVDENGLVIVLGARFDDPMAAERGFELPWETRSCNDSAGLCEAENGGSGTGTLNTPPFKDQKDDDERKPQTNHNKRGLVF